MVKIRLQRFGKKKAPFYHIVVADSKSPRDGKIIEQLGTYDPMTNQETIVLDKAKVETWIKNGAKPTDSVKALIEAIKTFPSKLDKSDHDLPLCDAKVLLTPTDTGLYLTESFTETGTGIVVTSIL